MIYLVRTLKETNWQTLSTDFVIESEQASSMRDFFDQYKIIILSLSEVKQRPNSAQFFWVLRNAHHEYKFCIQAQTLEAAIDRCIWLSLPLEELRDTTKPETKETSKKLIEKKKTKEQQRKQKEQEENAKRNAQQQEKYTDAKRQRVIKVINSTIKDIQRIEQKYTQNTTYQKYSKKLKDYRDELTKVRMGTNLVKANEILWKAFTIMEEIELSHIEMLQEQEYTISEKSSVSNIDIINELDNIKRAQQIKQVGGKQTASDLYYTYLGVVWIYQKFIAKDIFKQIKKLKHTSHIIVDYMHFIILMISIFVGFGLLYQIMTGHSDQSTIFFSLIKVGCVGFVWTSLTGILSSKSLWKLLLIIVLAIILSIVIYNTIIVYFALL